MLPQGYTPTSQGTMTGGHKKEEEVEEEEEEEVAVPASTASNGVRLDKSNIILLGPTGCGECVCAVKKSKTGNGLHYDARAYLTSGNA